MKRQPYHQLRAPVSAQHSPEHRLGNPCYQPHHDRAEGEEGEEVGDLSAIGEFALAIGFAFGVPVHARNQVSRYAIAQQLVAAQPIISPRVSPVTALTMPARTPAIAIDIARYLSLIAH